MTPLLLPPLESLINRYLKLDEQALSQLQQLAGKTFKLEIEDWGIVFFILITPQGIQLQQHINTPPSTTIRGKLNGLFKLSLAKGSNTALFDNKIAVEGDLNAGEALRHIFTAIDIDWEEQLSKLVGDIAAYKIGTAVHAVGNAFKKAQKTLGLNIKDFLQLEINALPLRKDVNHFMDAVTTLRFDVDRLEARLHRLQQNRKFDV